MAKDLHPLDVRRAGNDKLDPQKRVRLRDLGPRPDGEVRRAEEIDRIESPPRAPARRDDRAAAASGPWGATATEGQPTARPRRPRREAPAPAPAEEPTARSAGRSILRLVVRILLVVAVYLVLSRLLGGTGGMMSTF